MPADLADLERRVETLERAQRENAATLTWMSGTLGQVRAIVDDHTLRLQRMEDDGRRTQHELRGLREEMPGIVRDALREERS